MAASLRDLIEKLPRVMGYLGGQRTSYVQLDSVLALADADPAASSKADGALRYALALMRGRLDVEAPFNADVIRGHIAALEALRAASSEGRATWQRGNRQIHLVCRSFNQLACVIGDEDKQRTVTFSTPQDAEKAWDLIACSHVLPPAPVDGAAERAK